MITWICLALAVVAGLCSGVQGPANASVARSWDLSRSVTLNGLIVFVGAFIAWAFFRKPLPPDAARPPWSHMIGGFCGLTVISVAAFATPRIGASVFTTALVLGMLLASVLVDHFGWFGQTVVPVSPLRIVGLVLIAGGVALVRLTNGG